ncbi:hypothetical protein B0H16DRAFT_1719359 [Mycena metata]|uniref:Uncharacterized protein n=1 Tax=Mycena metata TaxID=1033252 RepID=A0AAD7JEJ5_9AGAR|nr:hypothetical protein B0H16DRAFT_1719359 [Mycena metata]
MPGRISLVFFVCVWQTLAAPMMLRDLSNTTPVAARAPAVDFFGPPDSASGSGVDIPDPSGVSTGAGVGLLQPFAPPASASGGGP